MTDSPLPSKERTYAEVRLRQAAERARVEPRTPHPIIAELRAVDNRPDFAQIYLRHLCLRAADVLANAGTTEPLSARPAFDVNYQAAMVFAVRELLDSLPASRDWFNPDAERVLREYLSDAKAHGQGTGSSQPPGVNVHGAALDRLGWICSVCHGWNPKGPVACQHAHSGSTATKSPEGG